MLKTNLNIRGKHTYVYFKNMRVVNRFILSAVLLSTAFSAQAQFNGTNSLSFYNLGQLNGLEGGRYTVTTISRERLFNPSYLKGALVFTKDGQTAFSGIGKRYVGESMELRVNGPVDAGKPIIFSGRTLVVGSVNIDIVNVKGETIQYKESQVRYDEQQQRLVIELPLVPGIYTFQIPVADGIASKTVIIQ